jgi:anti-anti-sigma factor
MIRAHEQPDVLILGVEGPATMMESPAVSELATEQLSRNVRALRIDLRACTTMDSTFSGTLLALKRQLDKVGGKLTLVSPSARVLELLEQMGLADFYDVEVANRVPVDGPWRVIAPAQPRAEQLRQLVVDAHDELARLPGPAARAFRTVVEELRKTSERGTEKSADDTMGREDSPETMRTAGFGVGLELVRAHLD